MPNNGRHVQERFPPQVLREYTLLADGQRGAICGPRGDLVWMCAPAWHDDAVFAALLGGPGVYAVAPTEPFVWGGSYEPRSLIWRNRWVTTSTTVECREALAYPADPTTVVLLRRVEAVERQVTVRVELDARAGFGLHGMRELARDGRGCWTARTGPLRLRLSGAGHAVPDDDGALRAEITVPAGSYHDLVLELTTGALGEPLDPELAWRSTRAAWSQQVPERTEAVAPRDAEHAYAVLRGMTAPGGGMAAAATMSLPERAEQGRNYDYRYSWIRDQCYAGIAVAAHGPGSLLDDAVSFVTARLLSDGERLQPAYTIGGAPIPDEHKLALPGYPGAQTIVRGNWVTRQFQLDAFGEILQLLAAAARYDRLGTDGVRALGVAVSAIEQRWRQPEAGVWELGEDWWTHSRLSVVAGLHAAAAIAPTRGDGDRMRSLAETILAETSLRCRHPDGHWQRSPTLTGPDASLVIPAARGGLDQCDPTTRATVAAVRNTLSDDGYVYRFPQSPRPLGDAEGAFLLCGFGMALAEWEQGEHAAALRRFERNRAACGPPGLFAEEYDVRQRQLRGNLPQAFVHAMLLECAGRLGEV